MYIYSQSGRPRGTSSKLYAKYNGSYEVLTRMGVSSYKVRGVATGVEFTVVGSNMIPARDYYVNRKAEEPETHPADLEDKKVDDAPVDSRESVDDLTAEELPVPSVGPATTDTKVRRTDQSQRLESLGHLDSKFSMTSMKYPWET